MAEPEEMEEDLFADLYDGDEATNDSKANKQNARTEPKSTVQTSTSGHEEPGYGEEPDTAAPPDSFEDVAVRIEDSQAQDVGDEVADNDRTQHASAAARDEPLQMKEDGKMFIGGLNWETTDESLFNYFSEFGEVAECTVMRDGASGRSRGFGFLTFKDPKVVNTVMVKEHFLDGKIIDPKRAIPRDEQEKTSKIFVGGVSQEATEEDFTAFFAQFGRVVDATLMMDKDTGRPRGFGFVTFDSEAAVERVLEHHPLEILGKPIEVKKAQPRGKMGEEEHDQRGGRKGKFGRSDGFDNQQPHQSQGQQNQNVMAGNGMTPQMMAQYWQKMQQYFAMMQQAMAANAMGGMGTMGQMNPQMMAQMQGMQNMQGGGMQGMTPQMQQQMMQMMQMQNGMNMGGNQRTMGPARTGFTAQEQQAFEQQKYEQQLQRRQHGGHHGHRGSFNQNQNQGGPQSWEGMYDGEPQPDGGSQNGRGSAGAVRNNTPQGNRPPKGPTPQPQSNAPANAPTGPKNAGKPGANFRGGRGGRYHPYGR